MQDPSLALGQTALSAALPSISREQAVVIGRWLVANSALGKARGTILKWLVDTGDKQVRGSWWCRRPR
jgi:hypothetical protein